MAYLFVPFPMTLETLKDIRLTQDLSNAHTLIGSCGSRAAGTDA